MFAGSTGKASQRSGELAGGGTCPSRRDGGYKDEDPVFNACAALRAISSRDMPGRTCVNCRNQRKGACASVEVSAADWLNADWRVARFGGVNCGSTTKSFPKML